MIKIDFKNFPINMNDELVTAYPAVIYIFNDFRFDGPILGYGMIERSGHDYLLSGKINPRIKDLIDSDVLELVPKAPKELDPRCCKCGKPDPSMSYIEAEGLILPICLPGA